MAGLAFPNVIAVFPGQGSQTVGMGKDLYENFSIAREIFEEASDAISVDLKKLCFDGPASDLTLTENTQPCLLVTSVAAFRVAQKELDFAPGVTAGHSLGEYSALVANGSLEISTATRWVRERGAAMQRAVPAGAGSMAAVMGMEDAIVQRLCSKATELAHEDRIRQGSTSPVEAVVEPANFNAPGQVVIAGSDDGVKKALELLKSDSEFSGGKAIPLQVSAPFHCRLMKPARDRMHQVFEATAFKPNTPLFPYVPNRTGRLTGEAGVVLGLLEEQVDHPVLWKQSVMALLEGPYNKAIEFGPGKVLTGLIKRIATQSSRNLSLANVSDSSGIKSLDAFLKS
ncbi:MAG: ACP S-malonyltransferase [Bdellovibrio sp.]|nr:ACP S-malonyltransferase [Bdellovibrio sp.]